MLQDGVGYGVEIARDQIGDGQRLCRLLGDLEPPSIEKTMESGNNPLQYVMKMEEKSGKLPKAVPRNLEKLSAQPYDV